MHKSRRTRVSARFRFRRRRCVRCPPTCRVRTLAQGAVLPCSRDPPRSVLRTTQPSTTPGNSAATIGPVALRPYLPVGLPFSGPSREILPHGCSVARQRETVNGGRLAMWESPESLQRRDIHPIRKATRRASWAVKDIARRRTAQGRKNTGIASLRRAKRVDTVDNKALPHLVDLRPYRT